MKILSLFDGISCARVAIEKLNIPIDCYYTSEIDKYACAITRKNYPTTIQLGDVTKLGKETPYPNSLRDGVDLIIFGSPCTDLSIAKQNRQGLQGDQSRLFFDAVRIMKYIPHKWFVMENVKSMSRESKEEITKIMGVEPILIDAALVSAQKRLRLFWTNIPNIEQPQDQGILSKDILEPPHGIPLTYSKIEKLKFNCIRGGGKNSGVSNKHNWDTFYMNKPIRIGEIGNGGQAERIYSIDGEARSLSANGGGGGANMGIYLTENEMVRKLTPIECERLQSLQDNFTKYGIDEKGREILISNTQRYKCLGNAFNADVVKHILSYIPQC